jgi:hypothetical protein
MPIAQEPTVTVSKIPLSPEQIQTSVQNRDHRGSELWDRVWLFWRLFSLKPWVFDIATFARIIHGEVHSCYSRICVLCASRILWGRGCSLGLDLGHAFERAPDGNWQLCSATRARNECIENISAKYPWLSHGDALLILEGWELGREFGLG